MNRKNLIVVFTFSASVLLFTASCATSDVSETRTISQAEPQLLAQTDNSNSLVFYSENGIAIKGTDTVAYFKEGKPVKGNSQFSYQWENATWHFKNAENRDLFASNPEKYAPQYGGFCAWAISENYTAPIDPNAWKIVNGKLYLNFNKTIQARWEKDISGHITKANQNWPAIMKNLQ